MTNAIAPTTNPLVVAYLARLDAAVGRLPHAEASDLVREIQAHITDKLEGRWEDAEVERVLRSLGPPEQLAANYRMELMFTRARSTFAPWTLLRTTAHWAKVGAKGLVAFLIGVVGYSCGLAMTITVLVKPFVPSIGLWVGEGQFELGLPLDTSSRQELLGDYYIPIITLLAFAIVVGTTQALRWLIRKRAPAVATY